MAAIFWKNSGWAITTYGIESLDSGQGPNEEHFAISHEELRDFSIRFPVWVAFDEFTEARQKYLEMLAAGKFEK